MSRLLFYPVLVFSLLLNLALSNVWLLLFAVGKMWTPDALG